MNPKASSYTGFFSRHATSVSNKAKRQPIFCLTNNNEAKERKIAFWKRIATTSTSS